MTKTIVEIENKSTMAYHYHGGQVMDRDPSCITEIVVEEYVEEIEDCAFRGCHNLKRVVFSLSSSSSVRCIGREAFYGCTSLEGIELPDSISEIRGYAFAGCQSLKHMFLPPNLQNLPKGLFQDCTSLKTIHLPSRLQDIGTKVFSGCFKLSDLTLSNHHNALFSLKELNLDFCAFGEHGLLKLATQLISSAAQLETLSLRNVTHKRGPQSHEPRFLNQDHLHHPAQRLELLDESDLPTVLDMVSASCQRLKTLDLSNNAFSSRVFARLASSQQGQSVLARLRHLRIRGLRVPSQGICCLRPDGTYETDSSAFHPNHLLGILEQHPHLAIWTDRFWKFSEDVTISHALEMNQFGCRDVAGSGIMVSGAVWPLFMEKAMVLQKRKMIRTGTPNIIYHLIRNNPLPLVTG